MRRLRWMMSCAVLLLVLSAAAAQAQDAGIVLSVRIPQFFEDVFTEALLAQFEAENPGVSVHVVSEGYGFASTPVSDMDGFLEAALEYASSADVLYFDDRVPPEATRAGLLLDLTPLTSSDPSLDISDFVPAAWRSFQWENAVWGLPVALDVIGLTYDKLAFDEAGIAYPSAAWTIDDLAAAARALTKYDENGNVTVPGFAAAGEAEFSALMRSLSGHGFYDDSLFPEAPALVDPALEALLTTWMELVEEGVVTHQYTGSYPEIPLRVEGSFSLMTFGEGVIIQTGQNNLYSGSPLPGGATFPSVRGFGVSAGTRYPEQAYALAKFLTARPEITARTFGARPARDSLVGIQPEANEEGPMIALLGNYSDENEAYINDAIANALPASELRYGGYVYAAAMSMEQNGIDARSALQEAEATAFANIEVAANQRQTSTVLVATPPPPVVLSEGEISLDFGLFSNISPLPNEQRWNQLIQEFVASDPQVGEIVFDTAAGRRGGTTEMAAQYDCFTLPFNYVPEVDTSTVLNLDPYLDADPSFSRSDIVGNTLAQVQRDAMTWALPLTLQLQVLNYSPERFSEAGAISPVSGWTIEQFVDALNALKVVTNDDPPFEPRSAGNIHLLLLIAAYGGLPLDFRTDPVTINFTDPATVDAIRQVLDLAKDGLISYEEQPRGAGARIVIAVAGTTDSNSIVPITAQTFSGFGSFRVEDIGENPYLMTSYPVGTQYTPLAYDVSTGYISASAENPDACYRWLSTVAQHPELFNGMPARRSLLNDPDVVTALGEATAAFYRQFESTLQNANTIIFPTPFTGASVDSFVLQSWLSRAFDEYVVRDGDLEAALADAEMTARAYQECVANLPPADPNAGEMQRVQQYLDCSTSVDPDN